MSDSYRCKKLHQWNRKFRDYINNVDVVDRPKYPYEYQNLMSKRLRNWDNMMHTRPTRRDTKTKLHRLLSDEMYEDEVLFLDYKKPYKYHD